MFNNTKHENGAVVGYPVAGRISSYFGVVRDVFGTGTSRPHTGVDIVAAQGTAVRAPAPGIVLDAFYLALASSQPWIAEWKRIYGNSLIVQHGEYVCLYAHLHSITAREGVRVAAGDLLGAVGTTGQSTGPHLHWGMAPKANRYLQTAHASGLVNPLDFLSAPVAPAAEHPALKHIRSAEAELAEARRLLGG